MKKPKYFKGAKKHKKDQKKPVVLISEKKDILSKAKSPKNSRSIPDKTKKTPRIYSANSRVVLKFFKKHQFWRESWNVVGIFLLIIIGINMYYLMHVITKENTARQATEAKLAEWSRVVATHSGYRDAYVQMAVLAYTLGDKNKAYEYISKAIALDPNNETAIQLEAEIKGK